MTERQGTHGPIFILCFARSGSTLLRVLLDTHSDVASPPETHIARVCETLERAWRAVTLDGGLGELPAAVLDDIRETVAKPMETYARNRGKRRWCDKSLDNLWLAPLLAKVFPDARFVCLFRQCLDFVMSGLEAGTWGFGAYGFENYVRESPGNTVRALVRYWCDYTEALIRFSDEHPHISARIRYEDIVTDSDAALRPVLEFLGLRPEPDLGKLAFVSPHDLGSGDHKLPFTSGISRRSIGGGRRVPVSSIPDDLRRRMNASLAELDYLLVGDDWNHRPVDHPPVLPDQRARTARALRTVLGADAVRVDGCGHDTDAATDRVLVVLEDLRVRWTVRLDTGALANCDQDCPVVGRVLTDSTTLRDIVAGDLNIGSALRTGALRATGRTTIVARLIDALSGLRSVVDGAAPVVGQRGRLGVDTR